MVFWVLWMLALTVLSSFWIEERPANLLDSNSDSHEHHSLLPLVAVIIAAPSPNPRSAYGVSGDLLLGRQVDASLSVMRLSISNAIL